MAIGIRPTVDFAFKQMFPDREFSEAAGVLEMISRTPEQQMLYDARLKFQRDEAARMEGAREEGREEERRKLVVVLRDLLRVAEPTDADLSNYNGEQLSKVAEELQARLRLREQ